MRASYTPSAQSCLSVHFNFVFASRGGAGGVDRCLAPLIAVRAPSDSYRLGNRTKETSA
jgi:hypothetical protein